MQNQSGRKQWLLSVAGVVFFAITFIIVYLANDSVPFMMDDMWYATRLYDSEPVQNLSDVIGAQIWHYFHWGGRSIAHGLLQLTLMTGWFWADVINMIFNILLICIVCKAAHVKGAAGLSLVWGMMYGLNANWKESLCWQSGAANYLYMTVFVLFFLWCYVRALEGADKPLLGAAVWIIPLGLAAGWSNENMGPAVWLLSLGIIAYLWRTERRRHLWMILGNVASLAGSILVIIAPGNFVRSSEAATEYGLLWRIFLRCYSESKAAFEYLSFTLFVLAAVLAVSVGICGIRLTKAHIVYLLAALLSWGAMILSPHYPDRATFGTMIFLICAIVSLAGETIKQRPQLKPWIFGAGSVIWLRGMFFLMEYTCMIWGWIK